MKVSFIQVLFTFAFVGAVFAQSKVTVDVYYESLCPDSRAFINEQLYPALTGDQSISTFVDLHLIPYGKSTYRTLGSGINYTCHHGPEECYGNKIHACALSKIEVNSYQQEFTKNSKTLQYINCLMQMASKGSPFPTAKCAEAVGISSPNFNSIELCANSSIEGNAELLKYAVLTDKFSTPLESVPTIVFNKQYEKSDQTMALTNFRAAACSKLGAPKPAVCPTSGSSMQIAAPIIILATYFASQFL